MFISYCPHVFCRIVHIVCHLVVRLCFNEGGSTCPSRKPSEYKSTHLHEFNRFSQVKMVYNNHDRSFLFTVKVNHYMILMEQQTIIEKTNVRPRIWHVYWKTIPIYNIDRFFRFSTPILMVINTAGNRNCAQTNIVNIWRRIIYLLKI